jgi:hypothetical protein
MELKRGSTMLIKNPSLLDDKVISERLNECIMITEKEENIDCQFSHKVIGAPLVNKMSKF